MGLFDRLSRVIKSNINDMISKSEDPQKMLNQLIVDMNEQLVEAKKNVASSIADEKKLERQMNKHYSEAKEWEEKARLAVNNNRDDLARKALSKKQEAEQLAEEYRPQWEAQHEAVEKLKNHLRGLQQKIEEAQRKKNLLVARAKRAEAQKKIQGSVGKLTDNSAFDAFDRMSQKVDRIEAEADASEELSKMDNEQSLDDEFAQLEGGSGGNTDLLLEQLKSDMKKESDSSQS